MRYFAFAAVASVLGWILVNAPGPGVAQSPVEELAAAWAQSPHADAQAAPFTHWNAEGEIPVGCATCHAGPGFRDFIGADGTAAGVVDHPVPVGSVIDCETCHNEVAEALTVVTFPSGVTVDDLGANARCMVCHQGTESAQSVAMAVGQIADDTVSADLAFINVHYRAAAASLLGTLVKGAYEYDGKEYAGRFGHPPPADSCIGCHEPHSLTVAIEPCSECHEGQPLMAMRVNLIDADGDGDVIEGVAGEIATMHERLLDAIGGYAASVAGTPIAYSAEAYPYFFADSNGDGVAGPDEAVFPNRYRSWTPRLLKAAYNYQFVAKDPGIFAHNPKYAMQILFDSIESLGRGVAVDPGTMVRP